MILTENKRILAKGCAVSNGAVKTGFNDADFIVGSSGSAKGSGYIIPEIMIKAIADGSFSSMKEAMKYGLAADMFKGA